MIGIPADRIDRGKVWQWLEHFAKRSHGTATAQGLLDELKLELRQLWVIGDYQAVVLTQVHPDAISIDFCAGSRREEWQDVVDLMVTAWARDIGKKWVLSRARPGWTRYARARGYRETHREFVKEA